MIWTASCPTARDGLSVPLCRRLDLPVSDTSAVHGHAHIAATGQTGGDTATLDRDEDGGIKVKTQARNAWHAQPDKKPHKLCPQRPLKMLYNFSTTYDITTR